jgi:hypothetical protein
VTNELSLSFIIYFVLEWVNLEWQTLHFEYSYKHVRFISPKNMSCLNHMQFRPKTITFRLRNQTLDKAERVLFYGLAVLVDLSHLTVEVSRSHSDTLHLVWLLRKSDGPVAETSTWQHTTLTGHISVPSVLFEPRVPANVRQQTHALSFLLYAGRLLFLLSIPGNAIDVNC